MDSCLRLGGWRLLRGIWLQKATMSATMRHLNPLWCPQLTHKVCAPAGRLGLAERANGLVLEPREQALGVKEVATRRDAARAVELVSANRAAGAHGPTNRHLLPARQDAVLARGSTARDDVHLNLVSQTENETFTMQVCRRHTSLDLTALLISYFFPHQLSISATTFAKCKGT